MLEADVKMRNKTNTSPMKNLNFDRMNKFETKTTSQRQD